MKRTRPFVMASGLGLISALMSASGCDAISNFFVECTDGGVCKSYQPPGSVKPACEARGSGDPRTDPTLITSECGLFVRGDLTDTDEDAGVGTPEKPYKTLQAAITAVTDKWIFVCAKNSFNERVTIGRDKIALYGGFACDSAWTWNKDARTTIQGPADAIALTISSADVKVTNFKIKAAKATKLGGSSIAVLVNNANPTFAQCEMLADQAQPGAPGVGAIMGDSASFGIKGKDGANACTADPVPGASGPASSNCTTSVGGTGGKGTSLLNGGNGEVGQPSDPQKGKGGIGETDMACTVGGDGADGAPGVKGLGATDLNLGTLDASGFKPAGGQDGTAGQPGQGGGGGGGAKGGSACTSATKGGASGGSGGSGGCGGKGGQGGQGAGASIAIISLDSPGMTLKDVTLTAAPGVAGGAGGDGQARGLGIAGGSGGLNSGIFGLNPGCTGGKGGNGGDGGAGGGGRGGHSIGLAYTGSLPTLELLNMSAQEGGPGGLGGNKNLSMNQGAKGIGKVTQDFSPK